MASDKQGLETERQRLVEERRQFEESRTREKTAEAGGGKAALASETPSSRSGEPQVAVGVPPSTPPVQPPTGKIWQNGIGMEFVRIRAGEFRMGSNDSDNNEKPVHRVRMVASH